MRTLVTKMDTHHVEQEAFSKTPNVNAHQANGSMENSVEAALQDVQLATTAETALHVKLDSTAGPTMMDAGTSAHSDTL